MKLKVFAVFIILFFCFSISANKVKFGTFLSVNAKPAGFGSTIPSYGFSAGYEMKYLYTKVALSTNFTPWSFFDTDSYFFFLDAGPRIPIYSGGTFQFSVPLAFRLSYFEYCEEAGDGACDDIKRLFAGGSFNLNLDWKVHKRFGVFCNFSVYFLGKIKDDSEYYYQDPTEMVDNTKDKFYVGVNFGSGISYGF